MSNVTSILLVCCDVGGSTKGQESILDELNRWLLEREPWRLNLFKKLANREVSGGDKTPGHTVLWAGFRAFHHHEDIVHWFLSYPWEYPENSVLIIEDDSVESTRVFRPELPSYHQHDPARWFD